MRRSAKGFTLVELLVVIAIIVLLISMLLPAWKPIREMVDRARCQAQLRGLFTAYMGYVTEAGRFPPLWSTIEYNFTTGEYASWYYPQHDYRLCVWGRFDASFGPLVWHRLIADPRTFVCPAIADSDFSWWHDEPIDPPAAWPENPTALDSEYFWTGQFNNRDPMALFDMYWKGQDIRSIGDTRSSYGVRPYLYPWTPTQVHAKGLRAIMSDNLNVPITVMERHHDGVNVAYIDGSIEYIQEKILWDNDLTWNYVPKTPTVDEIWTTLDKR